MGSKENDWSTSDQKEAPKTQGIERKTLRHMELKAHTKPKTHVHQKNLAYKT